jgi:hypothetical protein
MRTLGIIASLLWMHGSAAAGGTECLRNQAAFDRMSPGHTPEAMAETAACFRAAGLTNIAILIWSGITRDFQGTNDAISAYRELVREHESRGGLVDAARWLEDMALYLTDDADRQKTLIRATCLWRLDGWKQQARRAEAELLRKHPKFDSATLCDQITPPLPKPVWPRPDETHDLCFFPMPLHPGLEHTTNPARDPWRTPMAPARR